MTLHRAGQKHLESFKCCWRRMEKISWSDDVKKEYYIMSRREEISHIH